MRNHSELPQEIIFNIMCRVPAKSVGMCRCVSKPWRALLSQPIFVKTHLQLTKTNPIESLAITYATEGGCEGYVVPLNNAHHLLDEITLTLANPTLLGHISLPMIYGSCDGLFLATFDEENMVVMNPITRQIRQVPRPPLSLCSDDVVIMYGFGYDPVRDDYKIVIISGKYTRKYSELVTTFVHVYSLKTGSWKRLESPPYNVRSRSNEGPFAGGCVHLLYTRVADDKDAIAAFDLVEEKFREVPLPSSMLDNVGYDTIDILAYRLGVLEGCLCMFYYLTEHGDVWVMKEHGVLESWTKFVVNKPLRWCECFLSCQDQVVLMVDDDNRILWNLKQGTWKNIVFNGFSDSLDTLRIVATFVESLVSPHRRV